jgi:hypothetical protein
VQAMNHETLGPIILAKDSFKINNAEESPFTCEGYCLLNQKKTKEENKNNQADIDFEFIEWSD